MTDTMSDLESDYAALERLLDKIAAAPSDPCTDAVVADLAIRHERAVRRMESIGNRRILDVSDRDAHRAVGCQKLGEFLRIELRITNPRNRLRAVAQLQSMHAMTGEKLPPTCPNTADELASGAIGADHVDAILDVMRKIPAAVDPDDRAAAEELLAEHARTLTPREITKAGVRVLAHLDPDGHLTDDRDRARQRRLSLSCQDTQLMSKVFATLDPTTRALFEVMLAVWAAPGMNNPDDDRSPRGDTTDIDPEQLREAADRDTRSVGQRNHDALRALLQAAADGGLHGASHRGLPPHIIISITEDKLRERAGIAHTATGTDLPISDVLQMAARAQMHLAVFDEHTGEPLFLGRAHRLASQAQRFIAFSKYGGCSRTDCPTPFAHTEMHHAETDWADGGKTDADHMAPACGPHNRSVGTKPHQWETVKITEGPDRGRYGWRRNTDPPGEIRTNHLHLVDELIDRYRRAALGPWGESTARAETDTVDDPWGEPVPPEKPADLHTTPDDPWTESIDTTEPVEHPDPIDPDVDTADIDVDIEHRPVQLILERDPLPSRSDVTWPGDRVA